MLDVAPGAASRLALPVGAETTQPVSPYVEPDSTNVKAPPETSFAGVPSKSVARVSTQFVEAVPTVVTV